MSYLHKVGGLRLNFAFRRTYRRMALSLREQAAKGQGFISNVSCIARGDSEHCARALDPDAYARSTLCLAARQGLSLSRHSHTEIYVFFTPSSSNRMHRPGMNPTPKRLKSDTFFEIVRVDGLDHHGAQLKPAVSRVRVILDMTVYIGARDSQHYDNFWLTTHHFCTPKSYHALSTSEMFSA